MARRIKSSEINDIKVDLLKKQKGRCPLCLYRIRRMDDACLDHDHKTGFIRKVVCRNCNAIEGRIRGFINRAKRDKTMLEWLERLREYWVHHETDRTGLIHPSHKTEDEKKARRNKRAAKRRKALKQLDV